MILKSSLFILFLSGKNYISSFVATEGFMKNYTRYFFTQFCFLSNSKYYIDQNCTVINCTVLQLLKQNFKKNFLQHLFWWKSTILFPLLYIDAKTWMAGCVNDEVGGKKESRIILLEKACDFYQGSREDNESEFHDLPIFFPSKFIY